MKTEIAWLIEKNVPTDEHPIQYLGIFLDAFRWTPKGEEALRLARKQDADAVIGLYGDEAAQAVENAWIPMLRIELPPDDTE